MQTEEKCRSIIREFDGILFQLDKDFLPIFLEGTIEEITGYSKENFLSGNLKWKQIIEPKDLSDISLKMSNFVPGIRPFLELEFRIRRKDGEIRWIRVAIRRVLKSSNNREEFQGSVYDITERKIFEEAVKKQEDTRIKEIHHRIKNNLQVIASLLDLQAEKLSDNEICNTSKVVDAFKESQNRVISMALIHEELYKSKDMATLDFGRYLRKLTTSLLSMYAVQNENINLKLDFKQVYLGMDAAVPLGIIINELISNSLKHAFKPGQRGEISLNLHKNENYDRVCKAPADNGADRSGNEIDFQYTLVVADNGCGIPEETDIENTDSLGLQLIIVLVEQIEGRLELKRKGGTEFRISFNA